MKINYTNDIYEGLHWSNDENDRNMVGKNNISLTGLIFGITGEKYTHICRTDEIKNIILIVQ